MPRGDKMKKTELKLSEKDERLVAQKIIEMTRLGIHGPREGYHRETIYSPVFQTGEEKRIINLANVVIDLWEQELREEIENDMKSPQAQAEV